LHRIPSFLLKLAGLLIGAVSLFAGETVITINGGEEVITSTTDYTARTITAVSSRGWTKTTAMTKLWQPDSADLTGTGLPASTLTPTWREDGSLAGVSMNVGGATQSASFAADGKLSALTDPLLGDVFGSHSFASGKETLVVNSVTTKQSLDGTTHEISGPNVMAQGRAVAADVVNGDFADTITPVTGSATVRRHNAAGAKTTHHYAAGADITSTWLAGGLLEKQHIARGVDIAFTYSTNGAKDLTGIAWPTVPSTTFGEFYATTTALTHDTAGRVKTIADTSGSRTLDYDRGRLWKTDYTAGPLSEYFVERHHDTLGRLDQVTLKRDGQAIHAVAFAHTDDSPEVSGVTATGFSATLGRNTARHLTSVTSGSVSQSWTRGTAGRITAAGSNLSGAPSFAYTEFDTKGRRTKCTTSGGTWNYGYGTTGNPSSGQLTTASHPTLGSFSYTFDGIGRRASNTGSALNQFLTQTNSQSRNLLVAAHEDAHVQVWIGGQAVEEFTGSANFAMPSPATQGVWVEWSALAVLEDAGEGKLGHPNYNSHASPDAKAEQSGAVWVPPATENFSFDADGNRESSSLWNYGWDGRNKLVRASTINYAAAPEGWQLSFDYDAEGRRFKKNVTRWRNGAIVSQNRITFVWDGWNLIYELHQTPSGLTTLERKYVWGPDIAGGTGGDSGAGGAGGLLLIRETRGTQTKDYYPLYDGSGHVTGLTTIIDSVATLVAEYAYGPFGELIKSSGPMAQINPIRYATKYYDSETGLYYYGERYLDPITGQWLSREPLGESESVNLYAYTGNDPINFVDAGGLAKVALDANHNLTTFGKAILGIAKDDPEAARAILLAAQVNREMAGANVEGLVGNGGGGSVANVLRAIDTAVGTARHDGREEWKHIVAGISGASRDFDDGQATQDILVDSIFADYAPAIAASAANAASFNAARRAASDKETAYQNSPGYKLREIGGAIANMPGHIAAFGISAAMATDVTTGNTLTWNGWGNGFGLQEVTPGERAFAAAMVFLPIGRLEGVAEDGVRIAANGRSLAGTALRPWGARTETTALAKYWPGNSGFVGSMERMHLMPGTQIDRFGYSSGKFVSPVGTSFEARALPADYLANKPFHSYEIIKPIEVNSGSIRPWFGQSGMGIQYELPVSVEVLLERGFLREVGP
jgi:RHS repeat-associated protein